MKTECISDMCFLLANAEINLTQKLDEYNVARMNSLTQKWAQWNLMDRVVRNLSNVVVNSVGDVSICNGVMLLDTIRSFGCRQNYSFVGSCGVTSPVHDKVIVISQFWGESYCHAIIEGLPRLAAALDSLPPSESAGEWLVHSMMHLQPLAAQVTDVFGVRGIVGGDIRAERALVPTPTPCGGYTSGPMSSRLRSRIHRRLSPPCRPAARRILVVFRRRGPRELGNHAEVARTARRLWRGAVVEHGGEGTFRAQMELYAAAAAVLGPHGAGMVGMVAMQPGGAVAEVLPEAGDNRLNMCYVGLAHALGLRYYGVRAPGFHSSGRGAVPLAALEALPLWADPPPPPAAGPGQPPGSPA